MNEFSKVFNGVKIPLSESEIELIMQERLARKEESERKHSEKSARAARKSEILDKLKVTRDEWQILLEGD